MIPIIVPRNKITTNNLIPTISPTNTINTTVATTLVTSTMTTSTITTSTMTTTTEDDENDREVSFIEHLVELIQTGKKDPKTLSSHLDVPHALIDENWLYIERFLRFPGAGITFERLDEELKPYLQIGSIKLFGSLHQERRQTAYFSLDNAIMKYTGRVLTPNTIPPGSIISMLFDLLNRESFKIIMQQEYGIDMPRFNALFINKYRSPTELKRAGIEKPDALGWHSDDEREHASDIILSFSICETGGERIFEIRPRNLQLGSLSRRVELQNLSCFIMLPGCQSRWKHRVSDRLTRLNQEYVSGARYNLTFRSLHTTR